MLFSSTADTVKLNRNEEPFVIADSDAFPLVTVDAVRDIVENSFPTLSSPRDTWIDFKLTFEFASLGTVGFVGSTAAPRLNTFLKTAFCAKITCAAPVTVISAVHDWATVAATSPPPIAADASAAEIILFLFFMFKL